ncbi:MAG: thymidine kinase [Oscillospiraceae bacterium]|jgi:thymidine kinase|nr:thymidine kinase [Oscillospiraceae bacterium]
MLRFYFGVMGSSKSAMLLMQRYNYLDLGQCVALIKPAIDMRVGRHVVYSRVGLQAKADIIAEAASDLTQELRWFEAQQGRRLQHVFVDEAQFLTEDQVKALAELATEYEIHCYGLKTDFLGNFFPGSQALLRFGDVFQELEASLCWCGAKATMNARVDPHGMVIKHGEQVLIDDGMQISYVGMCYKHWKLGVAKPAGTGTPAKPGKRVKPG